MRLSFAVRALPLIVAAALAAVLVACGESETPVADRQAETPAQEAREQAAPQSQPEAPATAEPEARPGELEEPAEPPETDPPAEEQSAPEPAPEREPTPEPEPATLPAPAPFDQEFAVEVLRQLAAEIGPRVHGAPGELEAAQYLRDSFQRLGYDAVFQEFTVPGFSVGRVALTVAGEPVDANVFSLSAGGEVSGPVVVVPGLGSPDDFAQVDVEGAIALVQRGELFFEAKTANAAAAGAAAILISNNVAGPLQGGFQNPSAIPALAISREDGARIRQAAEAGPVQASLEVEGGVSGIPSQNVIARAPGATCTILVGGHYDTVPNVEGANDNGSGTALVVALARAYAGAQGSDNVCFVGFGAEEASAASGGINGSRALVQEWTASGELSEVDVMMNLDVAAGRGAQVIIGTPELQAVGEALADALAIDAAAGLLPPGSGSDHLSFQLAGIPVVFPSVLGGPIHTPDDTFASARLQVLHNMGRLAHALLGCLLARNGVSIEPPAGCLLP